MIGLNITIIINITIISVFSKLFEICLYNKLNGCLNVSDLQLGFVKEGGCD